jgi:hypothetical protein
MLRRVVEFHTRTHANAYAFVLALHQARKWVRILTRHDPTLKNAMKAFTASLKEIDDLRDMWEHEVDSSTGGGSVPTAGCDGSIRT